MNARVKTSPHLNKTTGTKTSKPQLPNTLNTLYPTTTNLLRISKQTSHSKITQSSQPKLIIKETSKGWNNSMTQMNRKS